jgi:hypothetical protein
MRDWNRTAVAGNIVFYPIVLQDEVASPTADYTKIFQ